MNPIQHLCLVALSLSLAATAGAQPAAAPEAKPPADARSEPVPAVAAAPAPAAMPAAPPAPAVAATGSAAPAVPPAPLNEPPAPPPPARNPDSTGRVVFGGAWDVGFPVGSVHDFTQAVSGLGFEFMARYFVLPQLTVGVGADFQSFAAAQPRTTYQVNNGALTATAYNSVQNAALRASVHYYFLKDAPVVPYAGLSVGVGWSTFQSAAADLAFYDNQASVLLGGDVGALLPVPNSGVALLAAVRYLALPAADFLSVSNVQTLSLQFGLLTL